MSSCPTCDNSFDTDRAMKIHHSIAHGESIAKETGNCSECGNRFQYYPSEKPGLYCSNCVESEDYRDTSGLNKNHSLFGEENPNYQGGRDYNCDWCSEVVYVSPSKLDSSNNIFCSKECSSSWKSENYQGDDNPFWKGGYNPNYSDGWWLARRQARNRDNHKCQLCGATESSTNRKCDVHHKKPVREFENPSDAHFLENLITLCRSCHSSVENGDRKI